MVEKVVVVVAGGAPPDPEAVLAVPLGAPVVAADRGVDHARALGLAVTVAVGDFDSVSPEALAAAEAGGARIERHPPAKAATDLELALDTAFAFGPERMLVITGEGGRLDHLLGVLLMLGARRYASVVIDAFVGQARCHVVRSERVISGDPGSLVSLFALGGPAEGVRTEGLVWALDGETLEPGSTRGVSNAFDGTEARISVDQGVVLVVRPGAETA